MASPLLPPREASSLRDQLCQPGVSLDGISASVHKALGSKTARFRLAAALAVLLREDHLPRGGRIAALYVLVDLYRHEQAVHPFLRIVLDAAENAAAEGVEGASERAFIMHLVSAPTGNKELGKRLPADVARDFSSALAAGTTPATVKAWLDEFDAQLPKIRDALRACAIRPAMLRASAAPGAGLSATSTLDEKSLLGVGPEFSRLPPPLFFPDDDLAWISPMSTPGFVFDEAMGDDMTGSEEIRALMGQALQGALTPEQAKQVKAVLDQDPGLVHKSGLSSSNLPKLVEHNYPVAIDILMRLVNSNQFPEFLSALVNMEMSVESMEVVNRLTASVQLPTEFLHLYISNCISSCENTKDKAIQVRNVRLVCVFLQSLIRSNIVRVHDVFLEVQAFCLEFSKIKEAAGLFKMLNAAAGEEGAGG